MTSVQSSVKHKQRHPFWYLFRSNLARTLWIGMIGILAGAVCSNIPSLLNVNWWGTTGSAGGTNVFILFSSFDRFYLVVLAVLPVVMAGICLKDVFSKKSVNVYFSLGISRDKLFLAKYASGLLTLLVSTALPMLADILANIHRFGSSAVLWRTGLYFLFGFCLMAFVIFSISFAVFCMVGTFAEGIAFSLLVAGLPTILEYSIQSLMLRFLYGAPYQSTPQLYTGGPYYQLTSLLGASKGWNPLLFLYDKLYTCGSATLGSDGVLYDWRNAPFQAPSLLSLVPWIFVGLAVFVIGMLAFRRRRAEIAGFLGACRPLNTIATFFLALLGASVLLAQTQGIPTILSLLLALLVFLMIAEIVQLLLLHNRREWLHAQKRVVTYLIPACVVVGLMAGGWFGYVTRLPDADKVEEICISTPISDLFAQEGPDGIVVGKDYPRSASGVTFNEKLPLYYGFTSDADKKLILSLHEQLIDSRKKARSDGRSVPVQICYRMKNGKTIQRVYSTVLTEDLQKMTALVETDLIHDNTKNILQKIGGSSGEITLSNPLLSNWDTASLTGQEMQRLTQALGADLEALGRNFYTQDKPTLGLLDIFLIPDKNPKTTEAALASLKNTQPFSIFLSAELTNTMAFLETSGLLEQLHALEGPPPQSVEIRSVAAIFAQPRSRYSESYFAYNQFTSQTYYEANDQRKQDWTFLFPGYNTLPVLSLTDLDSIAALDRASRSYGMIWEKGSVVTFLFDDERTVTRYLPAENAPQFLPDHVK